ncbi:methyltransferase small [Paraglaciecola sp. T6c]|uniref:tRNA1(Val) (adenine(37)-N6)-methyltransferase n=1 Tax=Pseudoalteromonas atlantica (strain T6c / ATCC BAA-1087) TaxID=3042615 RepID=TRMN6_PSEA6|nr:methyltransferase [Paraglaciecola sp. T6c]Q15NR8.1 RecName: Full=tRNA1(Val) (adenine(37)-N6)-methyltransferase; AltName: Full=tRNA m6A37 methyltransferase [Paraglaciecola sp. T6c]ABG42470.1 methyltransferase small [Paraglaciecola sp. T6c]
MKRQGFQFKQFFIEHQDCAMKVGTDSIMLGSWVTGGDLINASETQRFLDIGTGSGLLAIMLAQKSSEQTHISGIDIDKDAIGQATRNMANSPWSHRLDAQQASVQSFTQNCDNPKFALIISNPPYFNSPILTHEKQAQKRVAARQTSELTHHTLLNNVVRLLAPSGVFYCVLPSDVSQAFIELADPLGLSLIKQLTVFSKPDTNALRELLAFRFNDPSCIRDTISRALTSPEPPTRDTLTIYTQSHQYSDQYKALCKDYYLNF